MLFSVLSLQGSAITSSAAFSGTAAIINFDDLAGGNCNLCGPSVTNQYSAFGVTFNDPTPLSEATADTNLTASFPNASAPNLLYVGQGGMLSDSPYQPFQILFSVPVTMAGFDFGSSGDAYLQLDAYGAGHQLLESMNFTGTPAQIGLAGFAGLQESSPIVELDASYHPNSNPARTFSFSIDNLRFQGNPVPEPSTIGLIAIGLLAIAAARRR